MGNNYTVTIPNENLYTTMLTWKDLHAADFTFAENFHLKLAEDEVFFAEKIVRIIPKKRIVAFGTWRNKSVVAKLFIDPKYAKRHMEKDVAGIKKLRDHKIPTPALYYKGFSDDNRIQILLFERIFEAENLDDVWQKKDTLGNVWPLLRAVVIELATQHVLGLLQQDLHLKNYLLTEKRIYTLDGAQIKLFPHILPKKLSMANLALFLSQLGVGYEEDQEKLFKFYAKSRGWLLKQDDIFELFFLIKKWNDSRWKNFEKKIFRESTNFSCIHDLQTFGMYDRHYAKPELLNILHHPESAFNHPTMNMLKAGRSATVIKVTLDQREYVIKRYNMKNVWHHMRRSLRSTRALTSWRLAQKLNLFGVRTAKPVAFIEKRCLGFRGKSYYITEYVSGEHAGEFFHHHYNQEEKIASMTKQITTLLKSIAKLEITHGDLKITNILIDKHECPVLIDLDGAVEHASLSGLRSAWRKEIKRFMENFQDLPIVRERFKEELE